LNADNKINIEIGEKIAKGNKAYYAYAKLNYRYYRSCRNTNRN